MFGKNLIYASGGLILAVTIMVGCGQAPATQQPTTGPTRVEPVPPATAIDSATKRLEDRLMDLEGVTGIGVGRCDGSDCIKVFVVEAHQDLLDSIPQEFEGFPVAVEESGEFRPLPSDAEQNTEQDSG